MIPYFGADIGLVVDPSALVGVTRIDGDRYEVVSIDELRPRKGHPLKPKNVIGVFAVRIKSLGGDGFMADGHYKESVKEHFETEALRFVDAPSGGDGKEQTYLHARKLILEGRVRLPNHPRLLSQLRTVISRPKPGGGTQISIPRRAVGGHGDIVSALVLALWQAHHKRSRPRGSYIGHVNPGRAFEDVCVGGLSGDDGSNSGYGRTHPLHHEIARAMHSRWRQQ